MGVSAGDCEFVELAQNYGCTTRDAGMAKRPSRPAEPPSPAPPVDDAGTQRADVPMTTTTLHLPVDLVEALERAALRRRDARRRGDAKGRGGRPSVSGIVREFLSRHRDELDGMS
jgi:hypothetical protein